MNCCFIGHRKIEVTKELEEKLEYLVENLIMQKNVTTFLFGSRSEFDDLCHMVVTKLKEKYSFIKRVKFTCKSESCILEREREYIEKLISKFTNFNPQVCGYDEECEFMAKYVSGRASYLKRNQAMIEASDYCVFFYNPNYLPPKRRLAKRDIGYYQPNSGTKQAFYYAKQKGKEIINILDK